MAPVDIEENFGDLNSCKFFFGGLDAPKGPIVLCG